MLDRLFGGKNNKGKGKEKEANLEGFSDLERGVLKEAELQKGNMAYEYYDKIPNFKRIYDTTRVIIAKEPIEVDNKEIYECLVSWYSHNDKPIYNAQGMDISMRTRYERVFAEIDPALMKYNNEYAKAIMTRLLDQKRIREFINRALMTEEEVHKMAEEQENPNIVPCGRYIGGMKREEEFWKEDFTKSVGEKMHNSNEMFNERQLYKFSKEKQRRERESKAKSDFREQVG